MLKLDLTTGGTMQLTVDKDMGWRLATDIRALDSQRWLPDSAPHKLTLALDGQGSSRLFELAGRVGLDEKLIGIEALRAELIEDGSALQLHSLRLLAPDGGSLSSRGRVGFADGLDLDLFSEIEQLVIPVGDSEESLLLTGTLHSLGPLNELQLDLSDGTLQRGDLAAGLTLSGVLSGASLRIADLRLHNRNGEVGVKGVIGWQPVLGGRLDVQLRTFDPGLLWPQWPGRVSGNLRVEGEDDPTAARLDIELTQLAGELRGKSLRGSGRLALGAASAALELKVDLGDSRLLLTGDPREPLGINLQLAPLALDDVWPGASGRLTAALRVSGQRAAPRIAGSVNGESLVWADWRIGRIDLDLDAPLDGNGAGSVVLEGKEIHYADIVVDTVDLRLEGDRNRHTLRLALAGELGALQLAASGAATGGDWSGRIDELSLAPKTLPAWTLSEPVELVARDGRMELRRACLQSDAGGQLCVQAEQQSELRQATFEVSGLGLATIVSAMGVEGVQLDGELEAELSLQQRGDSPAEGRLALRLPSGMLAQDEAEERPLLSWHVITLDGELTADTLSLRLGGRLGETGSIAGEFSGGSPLADPEAEVSGSLNLNMPAIGALELVLPDLANVRGTLSANLDALGRWRAPRLSGSIRLASLTAELPALGLKLRDSHLQVNSDGKGMGIEGLIDTGGGTLRITGDLANAFGADAAGRLTLRGESVLMADTPHLRALVSPDLQLRFGKGKLRLTGSVVVPEAAIALEQAEGSVATSPDVLVLDPAIGATRSHPLALQTRIDVELGDKVTLHGFGFKGGISGRLAINERSGQVATGRGSLSLRGRYRAYGQDLEIQRGRLLFASSPLDNPALEVRAQRKFDDVLVGVEVSGSAGQPQLVVWSDPALDQAEVLSYLVLGRPLRSATAADGPKLGQAAAAIGGNLLAGRLGARLGFDTFGVADSQALDGAAFTVGKYLAGLVPELRRFLVRQRTSDHVALFAERALRCRDRDRPRESGWTELQRRTLRRF
ncbi:MAG: translocation/assembly module TamB domain-containing protein [Ahniella sp.]|nr:translocation/assembly module TamB domain-containing protein [Ahniella sp.]